MECKIKHPIKSWTNFKGKKVIINQIVVDLTPNNIIFFVKRNKEKERDRDVFNLVKVWNTIIFKKDNREKRFF